MACAVYTSYPKFLRREHGNAGVFRAENNRIGGRLDYGQPLALRHASCLFMSKALIAFLSLQVSNSVS